LLDKINRYVKITSMKETKEEQIKNINNCLFKPKTMNYKQQFNMFGDFAQALDNALHPEEHDLESEQRAELENNLGCDTNEMRKI